MLRVQPISPILDYASPRPRVKIRLPANSILRCQSDSPGSCSVLETLTGQQGAATALCFAAFVLCVVLGMPFTLEVGPRNYLGLTGVEAGALILVGLMVVRNTWRKTLLRVADGEMTVTFTAPLTPTRRYAWHVGMIERIEVIATEGNRILGELRVIPDAGAEVHLFTDHRLADLHHIAQMLKAATTHDAPPLSVAPAPSKPGGSAAPDDSPIE